MPSLPTQSNPPGFELVRIDKASFKGRFAKVYKSQVEEARLTLADILELEGWLGREDFAYAGRKWKEYFKSEAKVVGFDREVQTVLSSAWSLMSFYYIPPSVPNQLMMVGCGS